MSTLERRHNKKFYTSSIKDGLSVQQVGQQVVLQGPLSDKDGQVKDVQDQSTMEKFQSNQQVVQQVGKPGKKPKGMIKILQ